MKTAAGVIGAALAIILLASAVPLMNDAMQDVGHDDALHVFVIAGQSNAAYYISDVEEANEVTHISQNKAYFYGEATTPMYYGLNPSSPTYDTTFESYAIHDMVDSEGDFIIGGLESAFASKYVTETGNKVLLINTAIGGQTLQQMQAGGIGNEYAQAVFDHATALIPSTEEVIYESILFIQGESNSGLSINQYKSAFITMADSFMDFTGCDEIIISKVRDGNAVNPSTAQIQLCDEYANFILGSTAADSFTVENGLLTNDYLHYSQLGKNIIGQQLAAAFISHHSTMTVPMGDTVVTICIICIIAAIIVGLGSLIMKNRY